MVWIKNTANLEQFWISESLKEEARKVKGLTVEEEFRTLRFEDTMKG